MRGHLTEKADVFAFGVVALEAVAGRSNTDNSLEEDKIYLFEWVSCSILKPNKNTSVQFCQATCH